MPFKCLTGMSVLPAYMYVYHMYAWCLQRLEECWVPWMDLQVVIHYSLLTQGYSFGVWAKSWNVGKSWLFHFCPGPVEPSGC